MLLSIGSPELWANYGALGLIVFAFLIGTFFIVKWLGRQLEKAIASFISYLSEMTKNLILNSKELVKTNEKLNIISDEMKEIKSLIEDFKESNEELKDKTNSLLEEIKQWSKMTHETFKNFKK